MPKSASKCLHQSLTLLETDRIDILVSNAALQDVNDHVPTSRLKYEDFEKAMVDQAWGPLSLSLECLPFMTSGGRIIMISSGASKRPMGDPLLSNSASKAAMDSIVRHLGVLWGPSHGITVNSIGVGATDTKSLRRTIVALGKDGEKLRKTTQEMSPLGRIAKPSEVASIICFVASPEASWINGK